MTDRYLGFPFLHHLGASGALSLTKQAPQFLIGRIQVCLQLPIMAGRGRAGIVWIDVRFLLPCGLTLINNNNVDAETGSLLAEKKND